MSIPIEALVLSKTHPHQTKRFIMFYKGRKIGTVYEAKKVSWVWIIVGFIILLLLVGA